mmetsp:Transcript_20180/g.44195  ORF Transcript_20180/g.44195 Transcript_20180/m.44195 type:complete len:237 (-) Transcript_20180:390-1100(-)
MERARSSSFCAWRAFCLARSTISAFAFCCASICARSRALSLRSRARCSRSLVFSSSRSSFSICAICSLLRVRYLTTFWRISTRSCHASASSCSTCFSTSASILTRWRASLVASSTASCASSAFLVYSMDSFWILASFRYALWFTSSVCLDSCRLPACSIQLFSASSSSRAYLPPGPAEPLHQRGISCLDPRHTRSRYAWSLLRFHRLGFITDASSSASLALLGRSSAAFRLSSATV